MTSDTLQLMKHDGFTLMELLLVLGILSILALTVLTAINPTKQLNDARNAFRMSSIVQIENGSWQHLIDGNTLTGVPTSKANAIDICKAQTSPTDCTANSGYDLSAITPTYIVAIPEDTKEPNAYLSGFRLYRNGTLIKVCSSQLDGDCGI